MSNKDTCISVSVILSSVASNDEGIVLLKEKPHQYKAMLYFEDDHLRRNVSVASGPSDQPMLR